MSYSDEIRLLAFETFVKPARRLGKKRVSIPARDLHDALRYENRFPLVISALTARKFREANGLREPRIEGPAQSSTTVLHFDVV
jgi:hypothetical protein